jgi:hypothetical protein
MNTKRNKELTIQKTWVGGNPVTKITNNTDFKAFLIWKPNPPKRKMVKEMMIRPFEFMIVDQFDIDFTHIYISFEATDEN